MPDSPAGGIDTIAEIRLDLDAVTARPWKVVLYNDDVNTFDWVIQSLTAVLQISAEDASLKAATAHTAGRAVVADGDRDTCQSISERLGARQLTCEVQADGSPA